ncbi:hypothetical protein Tco_0911993, partial [Tanacetum coccineum]
MPYFYQTQGRKKSKTSETTSGSASGGLNLNEEADEAVEETQEFQPMGRDRAKAKKKAAGFSREGASSFVDLAPQQEKYKFPPARMIGKRSKQFENKPLTYAIKRNDSNSRKKESNCLQNNKPKIEKAQPKSKVETVAETETESEAVEVKIGALLKRDNSLRYKLNTEKLLENNDQNSSKRFSKDVVNKYLNKMKPARKSNEKSRFSEKSITLTSSSPRHLSFLSAFLPEKKRNKALVVVVSKF